MEEGGDPGSGLLLFAQSLTAICFIRLTSHQLRGRRLDLQLIYFFERVLWISGFRCESFRADGLFRYWAPRTTPIKFPLDERLRLRPADFPYQSVSKV